MKGFNIVILSEQDREYSSNKKLIESIEKKGHKAEILRPSKCYIYISDSDRGHDCVYYSEPEGVRKINTNEIDAIITRVADVEYGVPLVRHFSENLKIYCTQSAEGMRCAANKWETHQKLSSNKVKTLKSIFAQKPDDVEFLIKKVGGLPAIGKQLTGSQGKNVFILESPRAANSTLESMYAGNMNILIQQFIEAGNTDIRAIVIGGKVVVAMKRSGGNDFRANISRGGDGEKYELSDSDKKLCIDAAKAIKLDMAGVDLIKDVKNGTSYIVEVNSNFGLKVQEITKVSVTDAMVEHVEKEVEEKNGTSASYLNRYAKAYHKNPVKGEFEYLNKSFVYDALKSVMK